MIFENRVVRVPGELLVTRKAWTSSLVYNYLGTRDLEPRNRHQEPGKSLVLPKEISAPLV